MPGSNPRCPSRRIQRGPIRNWEGRKADRSRPLLGAIEAKHFGSRNRPTVQAAVVHGEPDNLRRIAQPAEDRPTYRFFARPLCPAARCRRTTRHDRRHANAVDCIDPVKSTDFPGPPKFCRRTQILYLPETRHRVVRRERRWCGAGQKSPNCCPILPAIVDVHSAASRAEGVDRERV